MASRASAGVRLQKVLAHAGVASRRAAEAMIRAGRVTVNGEVVTAMGTKVNPARDKVVVDGSDVAVERETRVYYLLNKPPRMISSASDPEGRPTVLDGLRDEISERVFPVGRLDWDAEGAMLLTNDGDLAEALLHPRNSVPRTYFVKVRGVPPDAVMKRVASGLRLDDGPTRKADVKLVAVTAKNSWVRMTMREGRNRQVKRMWEAVGFPVLKLKREAFAGLTVDDLPMGACRRLRPREVAVLWDAVKKRGEEKRNATTETQRHRDLTGKKKGIRKGKRIQGLLRKPVAGSR
ncbi:MAG: rRNA pseudouridine synthase [Deltaproteobacteria bacterium]|nr:rRNA pseudouridine synthase [Deltaproteobacteria bacterium]